MKTSVHSTIFGAIAIALLCTIGSAVAEQPPGRDEQHCKIGVGLYLALQGNLVPTKEQLAHRDDMKISSDWPLRVVGVMPNSPASRAKWQSRQYGELSMPFHALDVIQLVDGKSVDGLTISEAIALISNGPVGSEVKITARLLGISNEIMVVTRDTVCRVPVESE